MDYDTASKLAGQLVQQYPKLAGDPRVGRAIDLLRNNKVLPVADHHVVTSSKSTTVYEVNLANRSCECPDAAEGHVCKHRIAAKIYDMATDPS